jgi:hypothetical protein
MKIPQRVITAVCIALTVYTAIAGEKMPTNDFHDDEKTFSLPAETLCVDGEIANPGKVTLSTLPLRSVIVKEALSKKGKSTFIGAYRYDGYSLDDILNSYRLKKKNESEFRGCIDVYVTVTNKAGEKVVFSWGEIYYPNNRHSIIIATGVMRIVPSKTKDLWPLPKTSRVVVACDLLTERNISSPTKITVHSFPRSYKGPKGLTPLVADTLSFLSSGANDTFKLFSLPDSLQRLSYNTVFYGRGRGIHGISTFKGVPLKAIIAARMPQTAENIRRGILCFAAPDGYRCTFTYSELVNRNDQAEVLLMELPKGEPGSRFKLFASGDFFSDRAIKAIYEIYGTFTE